MVWESARADRTILLTICPAPIHWPSFRTKNPVIPFGGLLASTDACLGVEGRPQSASGQTTILTGINAPATVGYHKQGFPNQALLDIIREHSLFVQLKRAGVSPITFANTYTKRFFESRPRWISATTAAVEAAGLRFNQVEDLRAGAAVYHDFTNATADRARRAS